MIDMEFSKPPREILKDAGFTILTGEACKFSMRLLVDLTVEAKSILEDYLGNNVVVASGSNWNCIARNDSPSVASVMLPSEILDNLAWFIVARRWEYTIYIPDQKDDVNCINWVSVVYATNDETKARSTIEWLNSLHIQYRSTWPTPGQPSVGSCNVHAFSGRVT